MPEPVSTAASGIKMFGLMIVVAICILLAYVIVVIMNTPNTTKEWIASLASTIMMSLGMGSATMIYFNLSYLVTMPHPFIGWTVIGVIMFMWGLVGWFIVRLGFRTMEASENKDFFEIARQIKDLIFKR